MLHLLIVQNRRVAKCEKIGFLEATLKRCDEEFSQLDGERNKDLENATAWDYRFERETTHDKKLLASASGIALINKTIDDAISECQASNEFEIIVVDRVTPIYEDVINSYHRALRRALHEKEQVTKEDISLLDPNLSEKEEEIAHGGAS
ncbi:UNVERIFIED_CONTAM: hypothetical protein Sangu_2441600 [Sesamum angustifolium]|uniref:Uncharacterized protein n=1 Tax=Sesamum angustifolium TaxID=2727405 RepID=A0AAW2KYL1_9LAMI